jgi:hypothetical protein
MMIVLGYFLIAAAAVIAASAIIGFFLANLLILLLQIMDRSIRLYRAKVPAFFAPPRISPTPLSNVSKSFSRNGAEEVWAEYTDSTPREKVVI